MLGTTLIIVGLAGLVGKAIQTLAEDNCQPEKFTATIAKTRLDIKKSEGVEYYTYIVTFFIQEKNRYLSLSVSQKQFDEAIVKDSGELICDINKHKFFRWKPTCCG
ncbi:MAG: hypothetical protein FWB96_10785 [Defluviitaleaceae bacterium]|nr:hypothetical protein [Defluviitaleaceae bacterium]MCL2263369.1 hypothetical protein [Defluviitaleaceae bacterium]